MPRLWNPWDDLERLEAEHGGHDQLVDDYCQARARENWQAPPGTEAKRLYRLLQQHSRLIWACVAYNAGLEAGRKEKSDAA